MTTDRPHYLETARKVLAEYHPQAKVAFVAGSVARGEETPTSDIDLIVIYEDGFDDVHRHSITCDGWPVEMFVHNVKSNDFYIDKDVQRGMPAMPSMIAEGVEITVPSEVSAARKTRARAVLEAGPPALDAQQMEMRRYMLTDLLDDIEGGAKKDMPVMMPLSLLYQELADFYLRARGRWSGRGKSLIRALEKNFPDLTTRYQAAFIEAFSLEGIDGVLSIADEMLEPFGGRLWAGLRHKAPDDWKKRVIDV